ncbi:MAG: NAD(P)/FAD-dependent oxidoreductase [Alphaproteobacteria bacterium]|jgi:thioredoxin reductase (NADPH)|nr:NAD(P)/FAD-dependent oxidoreductase [Alphaproteobacteria bacterium]
MSEMVERSDVAIIGAGPVGLFAVFELGMLGIEAIVVDALDAVGGQCTALYPEKPIYDIPGYPRIDAGELVARLEEQARPFRPRYRLGRRVVDLDETEDGGWRLAAEDGSTIEARAVIIAAGGGAFGPNRPPLAGIEAYEGRSVHYYVKSREVFRGKRIVIAGGGDSAVDWALSLADLADRIHVVHRRQKFRAAPESVKDLHRLADAGNVVELVIPYQLKALEGTNGDLNAVVVATLEGEERCLEADALLAFFGLASDLGPLAGWGLALDGNRIVVDPARAETSAKGIFAIGDIASYPGKLKLILSGFAEAAMAAHAIHGIVRPDEALHFEYSTTKGLPSAD